jgi:hypothetical protein
MEQVLDVYKRPYNPEYPVICGDESPKQLIGEMRQPIAMKRGKSMKYDSEYVRNGVCNIFMMVEPLAGQRYVSVTTNRKRKDWAEWIRSIVDDYYSDSKRITIVQDNLNTHNPANLYEYFAPEEAKRLIDKIDFVYTPKHGSWLNIAEIELNVLQNNGLKVRMENIENVTNATKAWESERNNKIKKINWQFTNEDARIKLKRLYPSL